MRHLVEFLDYIKNVRRYSPNTILSYKKGGLGVVVRGIPGYRARIRI